MIDLCLVCDLLSYEINSMYHTKIFVTLKIRQPQAVAFGSSKLRKWLFVLAFHDVNIRPNMFTKE